MKFIKREFTEDDLKKYKKVIKVENYYILYDGENIYIGGSIIGNLAKLNIFLFSYQIRRGKDLIDDMGEDSPIEFEEDEILYTVSMITHEGILAHKYVGELKMISFFFEKQSSALIWISLLEKLRFANFEYDKVSEIFQG